MKKAILIGLTLISLMACETKNNKPDKDEEQKVLQNKKENLLSELTEKYAVEYLIDTLRYNYSIQFKELLETDYQIISRFRILDIYKKDSITYISIETGFLPTIYFELEIPTNQVKKLLELEKCYFCTHDGIFVVKILNIKKGKSCSTEVKSIMSFWGNGKVIEIHPFMGITDNYIQNANNENESTKRNKKAQVKEKTNEPFDYNSLLKDD